MGRPGLGASVSAVSIVSSGMDAMRSAVDRPAFVGPQVLFWPGLYGGHFAGISLQAEESVQKE